jgi:hypothetical protein
MCAFTIFLVQWSQSILEAVMQFKRVATLSDCPPSVLSRRSRPCIPTNSAGDGKGAKRPDPPQSTNHGRFQSNDWSTRLIWLGNTKMTDRFVLHPDPLLLLPSGSISDNKRDPRGTALRYGRWMVSFVWIFARSFRGWLDLLLNKKLMQLFSLHTA